MADPEKLDTLQVVELADGVEIRLRMAGPMLRAGAYGIDFMIRGAVLILGASIISIAGLAIGGEVARGLILLTERLSLSDEKVRSQRPRKSASVWKSTQNHPISNR